MAHWRHPRTKETTDSQISGLSSYSSPSKEKRAKQEALRRRLLGPSDPFREHILRPKKDTIWDAVNNSVDKNTPVNRNAAQADNNAEQLYGNVAQLNCDGESDSRNISDSAKRNESQDTISLLTDTSRSRFFSTASPHLKNSKSKTRKSSNSDTTVTVSRKYSRKSKGSTQYTPLEEQWVALKRENVTIIAFLSRRMNSTLYILSSYISF